MHLITTIYIIIIVVINSIYYQIGVKNMKKTFEQVKAKYDAGKLLSKGDCKVIIDRIYSDFRNKEYNETLFDVLINNAEKVVEKLGRPLSDTEVKDYYGLSFCNNHTAKMAGMESLSTNNKVNERCAKNKCIPGSICEFCFADRQIDMFSSMDKPLTINYLLLNYKVLPVSILPIINRQYARFESFGDAASAIQAINYCNICTAHEINRNCNFAAWSKNPDYWYPAFRMVGKPENLSFGVSSLFLNKENTIPEKYKKYVDFLFTVFETEKAAVEAGFTVNCGARHCLSCLRCYKANKSKELTHVIEIKK